MQLKERKVTRMIKKMLSNAKCKQWWNAALKRAWHAVWQTAVPLIPAGMAITQIDWRLVVGLSLTSGVLSLAKSFAAGLPECGIESIVKNTEEKDGE